MRTQFISIFSNKLESSDCPDLILPHCPNKEHIVHLFAPSFHDPINSYEKPSRLSAPRYAKRFSYCLQSNAPGACSQTPPHKTKMMLVKKKKKKKKNKNLKMDKPFVINRR